MRVIATVLMILSTIGAGSAAGQSPAVPERPSPAPGGAPATPAQTADRIFAAGTGLIFSAVRKERVADFEQILSRLRQALVASADPVRRQQAEGWRMFRSVEPGPNGSVLYVFLIDPVVEGADYGVARILAEAFPTEIQELYKLYSGSFAGGQTLLNLEPVGGQAVGAERIGTAP